MKMKFITSLFAFLTLALVGCGNNSGGGNTPKTDEPKIIIEQTSVSIEKFEGLLLDYELVNIKETVTWSSTNEEVATVVDGYISGVGVGTCTVTATAGKAQATVDVEIAAPSEAAVLHLETTSLTIIKTKSVTIDLYVTYKGEVVEDAEFDITATSGTNVTASYEAGRLTLTGKTTGTTVFSIVSNTRDTLLIGELTAKVINV